MNILHTGDWHLGKTLEGFSRLEEQEMFLDDFVRIAEEHSIDLVIIAGDVYDSFNPSAKAEKMFYDTLKRLSDGLKLSYTSPAIITRSMRCSSAIRTKSSRNISCSSNLLNPSSVFPRCQSAVCRIFMCPPYDIGFFE
ncbi:MAG: exonuclease subunit SbcD, partial [Dethiosulfatibacter sp.]|nr:exonuclease subunit SbcD [Dethiosulfatibacter sp.]